MSLDELRHKADLLRDLLSSSQDLADRARAARSPTLEHLSNMLMRRSFDELDEVERRIEGAMAVRAADL